MDRAHQIYRLETIIQILEKNYRKLEFRLANKVDTVDGLLREHRDFLDTCLKECMLTNSKLLKHVRCLHHTPPHFTKSAHKVSTQHFKTDGFSKLDVDSQGRLGLDDENEDNDEDEDDDDDEDDDSNESKSGNQSRKKNIALASQI
ncbi:hypothetical protein Pst134EA_032941 [Puccinia striiformis f. sp. tritici]|uniref:uncharacterized protein n=1 Tax=Puccinia striiformis f. sp. tritici TaxID=168172 RepID=UPI0020082BC9|nr:uncharacterized protein Pst134EA_032941 [Puccinia striiformis f. sp. tritici]KAH9441506.1 hypothetical protein Pst134EA_032941 [Puccinia striiformis f. sp. tritici]